MDRDCSNIIIIHDYSKKILILQYKCNYVNHVIQAHLIFFFNIYVPILCQVLCFTHTEST